MKIYFAGSIRGGRDDAALYMKIIQHLQTYGEVLTEHVGSDALVESGEKSLTDVEIHDRDIQWLHKSDVFVAEVTQPSLGVGYEVRAAIEKGLNILCLFRNHDNSALSAMVAGAPGLKVAGYIDIDGAKNEIDTFFRNLT